MSHACLCVPRFPCAATSAVLCGDGVGRYAPEPIEATRAGDIVVLVPDRSRGREVESTNDMAPPLGAPLGVAQVGLAVLSTPRGGVTQLYPAADGEDSKEEKKETDPSAPETPTAAPPRDERAASAEEHEELVVASAEEQKQNGNLAEEPNGRHFLIGGDSLRTEVGGEASAEFAVQSHESNVFESGKDSLAARRSAGDHGILGMMGNAVGQAVEQAGQLPGQLAHMDEIIDLRRGFSSLAKTFKSLQESVLEVVRVTNIEAYIPPEIAKNSNMYMIVQIRQAAKVRCCKRKAFHVFAEAKCPLHECTDGRFSTGPISLNARTPRLARRRGILEVHIDVMAERPPGKHRASRKSVKTGEATAAAGKKDKGELRTQFKLHVPGYIGNRNEVLLEADRQSQVATNSRTLGSTSSGIHSHLSFGLDDQLGAKVKLQVLSSSVVFNADKCKPSKGTLSLGNEWRPSGRQWREVWKTTFEEHDLLNPSRLVDTMCKDMKSDAILMYQTMFAQNLQKPPTAPPMTAQETELHDLRVLFLKRLFLAMAVSRLTMCVLENGTAARSWPFPLASALCHGSRVLIRLDGVKWEAFVNFLLLGDEEGHAWHDSNHEKVPPPFWARWAATHAIGLQQEKCQLLEQRLKKRDSLKNLRDGLTSHHLGMDLPVGGLGNPAPSRSAFDKDEVSPASPSDQEDRGKGGRLFVGPAGIPFTKKTVKGKETCQYVDQIQNGHLYMRWDDFGSAVQVPVLEHVAELNKNANVGDSSPGGRSSNISIGPSASNDSKDELHASKANSGHSVGSSAALSEEWFQLPTMHSPDDLKQVLVDKGYTELANDPVIFAKLYRSLVQDNELALQSNEKGQLRCRGVLIHLMMQHEEEGKPTTSLVQLKASALAYEEKAPENTALSGPLNNPFAKAPLNIKIFSASGLRAADYNGKSDPYCIVRIQGRKKESCRTPIIKKSLAPVWNAEFQIPDYCMGEALEFKIYDHDYMSGDDLLGRIVLPSADFSDSMFEGSMGLMDAGKGGENARIKIRVHLLRDESDKEANQEESVQDTMKNLLAKKKAEREPKHVADVSVPTMVRRRHESWPEAVSRYAQTVLKLSVPVAERIVKLCEEGSEDVCIYNCVPSETVCHHHMSLQKSIAIDYQAFRFAFKITGKDRELFDPLLKTTESFEGPVPIENFGGMSEGEGEITRHWRWLSEWDAKDSGCKYLTPPDDRMQIIKETGQLSALLIGIEGSSPGKESFFGSKHTAKATSSEVSAFGTRKWRDYRKGGQEVPADIGGMHLVVDEAIFDEWKNLCNHMRLCSPSHGYLEPSQPGGKEQQLERRIFRELLSSPEDQAPEILSKVQFRKPSLRAHTGTQVFETYVRERASRGGKRSMSSSSVSERSSCDSNGEEE